MARPGKIIASAIVFLLLFAFGKAFAQVSATATVDRNQLSVGDTLTFSVSVDSESSVDIAQPRWPDLRGFDILNSWSGSEIQSVFENGRFTTKRRQSYNLQLQALEKGVFEIGAAEVVVDGQSLRTKPIRIEVTDGTTQTPPRARQNQRNQQNPVFPGLPSDEEISGLDDMFNQMLQDRFNRFQQPRGQNQGQDRDDINAEDLFFIDVAVDKTKVYEGEQVLTSYYLYTRGQITDIDTLKYPTLVGFWKEDIELATRLNFQPIVLNGIRYNRALLASYALFPIKSGQAKIDSYKAKCKIVSMNPFGSPLQRSETKESKIINIEVMPLPENGKPSDFAGAVGRFDIQTKLDNPSPKTNQPVNLSIRFEGRGNGKLIEIPKLPFPKGIDVYDSKSESKFFKDGRSYKQFDILIIPRQAGEVEIPAFSVSLFDPTKKTYYKLDSPAIPLNVLPGDQQDQVQSSPLATSSGQKVQQNIFPAPIIQYKSAGTFAGANYIWLGLYTFVISLMVWFSRIELGWGRKKETLKRLVQRRISSLHDLVKKKDMKQAASVSINLVYFVLGELSGLGGGSQELKKMIAKAPPSFRREFQEGLEKQMSELEVIAFAPDEVFNAIKNEKEVEKRISEIEKLLLKAIDQDFDQNLEDLDA